MGRCRVGRVSPPLWLASALGQHIADLALHLDEGELEFIGLLFAEIVSKRIVFGHRPTKPDSDVIAKGQARMKTYAEALEPDSRYRIVMTDDPIDGLRPSSFRDHYDMVADLELPAGVPEVVVRIYARALNALIYGWLDYELMVVAAGQALASLEFALKTRLGADANKMPGLARRLGYAVERNILSAPQTSQWGDDHALLVHIRNEIAHGSEHIYPPNLAAIIFDRCRALICELNALPAPSLRQR